MGYGRLSKPRRPGPGLPAVPYPMAVNHRHFWPYPPGLNTHLQFSTFPKSHNANIPTITVRNSQPPGLNSPNLQFSTVPTSHNDNILTITVRSPQPPSLNAHLQFSTVPKSRNDSLPISTVTPPGLPAQHPTPTAFRTGFAEYLPRAGESIVMFAPV